MPKGSSGWWQNWGWAQLLILARPFCDDVNDCLPSIPVSSAEGARARLEFHLLSLPLRSHCAWADAVGGAAMTASTLSACCIAGCSAMGPGGTRVSAMLLLRVCWQQVWTGVRTISEWPQSQCRRQVCCGWGTSAVGQCHTQVILEGGEWR